MTHRIGKHTAITLLIRLMLIGLVVGTLAACQSGSPGSTPSPTATAAATSTQAPSPTATPTPSPTPSPTATPTPLPTSFVVTSVDLVVAPASIAGLACGRSLTFTYTATFHIPAGTRGGVIQFIYTWNDGHASPSGRVTVSPGQTHATFTFTSPGTLSLDHNFPGIAQVLVSSPNIVDSPEVKVTGACTPGAAFKVMRIDLTVSPSSIAGLACGTAATVTYTATFWIAPDSVGGTIAFEYTWDYRRSSTSASVTVAPGQLTATYSFTWSGTFSEDHVYPGAEP